MGGIDPKYAIFEVLMGKVCYRSEVEWSSGAGPIPVRNDRTVRLALVPPLLSPASPPGHG